MQGLIRGCSVEESGGRIFGEAFVSKVTRSRLKHVPVLHLELPAKFSLFFYHIERKTLPHFTAHGTSRASYVV